MARRKENELSIVWSIYLGCQEPEIYIKVLESRIKTPDLVRMQ